MYVIESNGVKRVVLESEPILPCPFCGSTTIELCNTHTAAYWMECQGCGAQVNGEGFDDEKKGENHIESAKSALLKWNSRI